MKTVMIVLQQQSIIITIIINESNEHFTLILLRFSRMKFTHTHAQDRKINRCESKHEERQNLKCLSSSII